MTTTGPGDDPRYAVQRRVAQVGAAGQARLARSRAVVVGVGALGGTIATQLVRAGVGHVVVIDPDRVELGNLHRQVLYTEADAAVGRPKVEAAVERLRAANGAVTIEGIVARLGAENAEDLLRGADVVVDGTDNLATRFLLNDRCVRAGVPWVYGGIAGVHGMVMPVLPGVGPCLRCLFADEPSAEEVSTAQTDGVLGPAPAVVGALEAAQALRILVGGVAPPVRLLSIDVWTCASDCLEVARAPGCPTCGGGPAGR
jgi:molybdopterin-synthase adenylyltransferase